MNIPLLKYLSVRMCAAFLFPLLRVATMAEQPEIEPNNVRGPGRAPFFDESEGPTMMTAVLRGRIDPAGDVDYFMLPPMPPGTILHAHIDNGGVMDPEATTRALTLEVVNSVVGPVAVGLIERDLVDGTGTGGDDSVESMDSPAIAGVVIPPVAVSPGPFWLRVSSPDPIGVVAPYRVFVNWRMPLPPVPASVEAAGVEVLPPPIDVIPPGGGGLMGDIAAESMDIDPVELPEVPPFTAVHLSLDGDPVAPRGAATDLVLLMPAELGGLLIDSSGAGAAGNPPAEAVFFDNNTAEPIPPSLAGVFANSVGPTAPWQLFVSLHPHGMLALSDSTVVVSEGARTAEVKVTRVGGCFGAISVNYRTSVGLDVPAELPLANFLVDPRAEPGSDFTDTTGTLTFGPGQMTATISVPIITDSVTEFDETLLVELFSPVNTTLPTVTTAKILILDDDDGDSTPATARPLDLTTGTAVVSGGISPPEDQEWVRFSAPDGARVTAVINTGADPAITEPVLRLALVAGDGTTVLEFDRRDGWTGVMVKGGSLSRVPAIISRPLTAGDYFLRVDSPVGIMVRAWRLCVVLETEAAEPVIDSGEPAIEPLFQSLWPVASRTGVVTAAKERFVLL